MNVDALVKKLLVAARGHPPSEHVPYAFEKRIMACLKAVAPADAWTLWGRPLWRAAVSCLVIMALASIWALWTARNTSSGDDFSQELETAVFAMADPPGDAQ